MWELDVVDVFVELKWRKKARFHILSAKTRQNLEEAEPLPWAHVSFHRGFPASGNERAKDLVFCVDLRRTIQLKVVLQAKQNQTLK